MTRLRKQTWIVFAVLLAFAIILRLNVRQGRVFGPSMEPTYHSGETVLVWKSVPRSRLKPGDVIVFRDTNGDELIKRIAFIRPLWHSTPPAGLYRGVSNGRQIPYSLLFGRCFQKIAQGKTHIPLRDHTIYVLGDNLLESDDSRRIGRLASSKS